MYNRDMETFGRGQEETQDLLQRVAGGGSKEPSASQKPQNQTQRRIEEAALSPNDKGSNKVTDCSEITARHKPGSPAGAEIEGDQIKSGLPTPKSTEKRSGEIELKAEVTVKPKAADLNLNPNAPLTPSSERSRNSKNGQVIFSKKHVHSSLKREAPDKRQGRVTSGNLNGEKGLITPGR